MVKTEKKKHRTRGELVSAGLVNGGVYFRVIMDM